MVWGYLEDDRPWHDDINDPVADDYNVILGFNEPNHADQSDIPPEVAASAWLELQNLYPNKVSRHTGDTRGTHRGHTGDTRGTSTLTSLRRL